MQGEPAVIGTQVSLRFAAGTVDHEAGTRRQLSSTWVIRVTRGFEVFIVPREAGGDFAHISFHKDGKCHIKFKKTHDGKPEVVKDWALPDPLEGTRVTRLADILIPASGLVPPLAVTNDPNVALVEPPNPGQQLAVTLLVEPGNTDPGSWPGKTAMGTRFVGRMALFTDEHGPLLDFVAVASYAPESETFRRFAQARFTPAAGAEPPTALRGIIFGIEHVDGREGPWLAEMPVAHETRE